MNQEKVFAATESALNAAANVLMREWLQQSRRRNELCREINEEISKLPKQPDGNLLICRLANGPNALASFFIVGNVDMGKTVLKRLVVLDEISESYINVNDLLQYLGEEAVRVIVKYSPKIVSISAERNWCSESLERILEFHRGLVSAQDELDLALGGIDRRNYDQLKKVADDERACREVIGAQAPCIE